MTKQDFINNVIPVIQKVANKNGYKYPSAIISQAACESNWGKSSLSDKYYNYFGMKCGSKYKGKSVNMSTKEEYKVGTLTTIKDNFRAYNSLEEGIQGYFDFIGSMSRYSNLKTATSPENYIQLLKQDGWATSSTYVKTLTNILNTNGFKKYDTETANVQTSQTIQQTQTTTSQNRTIVINCIKGVQTALNNFGHYGLAVDGIVGPKTKEAIKRFNNSRGLKDYVKYQVKLLQTALNNYGNYGLKIDGIAGPKTIAAIDKFQKK